MRGLIKVFVRLAIFAGMWAAVQAGVKTLTAKHLGGEQRRHVAAQQENEGPLSGIKKMVAGNNTSNQIARSRPVTGAGVVWGEATGSSENYYKDYPGRK